MNQGQDEKQDSQFATKTIMQHEYDRIIGKLTFAVRYIQAAKPKDWEDALVVLVGKEQSQKFVDEAIKKAEENAKTKLKAVDQEESTQVQ